MMPELVQNLTHFQVNVPVNSNSTTNWVRFFLWVRWLTSSLIAQGQAISLVGFFSVVERPCEIVSMFVTSTGALQGG